MAKEAPLYYAYSDDSPTLAGQESRLAVAAVVTLNAGDKALARIPKRVRQRIVDKKLQQLPELKFYNSDEKTKVRMLQMIANTPVEIFALVVDKEGRRVSDSPLNNGVVLGNAVAAVLKDKGRVNWTPDRKFVNRDDTVQYLDTAVRVAANKAPSGFLVMKEPADSRREALVQLADFVVGAISHKYNRNDGHYYQVIKKQVVLEEVVRWKDIKADYIRQQKR